MEEKRSPKDHHGADSGHEQSPERSAPARVVIEPEDAGGDPPCWAHLVDDEGHLHEDPE
jgi:hypothetical protein